MAANRNLYDLPAGDVEKYVAKFLEIDNDLKALHLITAALVLDKEKATRLCESIKESGQKLLEVITEVAFLGAEDELCSTVLSENAGARRPNLTVVE